MNLDDLAGLVALTEIGGIGDKRALELYRTFEDIDDLLDSPRDAFSEYHYVDAEAYDRLQSLEPIIEETRQRFDRYRADGIDVIGIEDDRYPAALAAQHSPLVIYAKGNTELLQQRSISFSGSRETNIAGQKWAREIARDLAAEGYAIVSGGATGADTAAHEGALEAGGATVVVLGTGVETPYPEENEPLFEQIVDTDGVLVSHRRPTAGPTRSGFLDRNKTLSALSPGLVIVATDGSGGTMSQYDDATAQERQVFVPTSTLDIQPYKGVTEIVNTGSPLAIETAPEIVEWYQREGSARSSDAGLDSETGHSGDDTGQATLADWGSDSDER
ncbi:DNA-processing protein DprA [Natrinema sp. 1APR25-10V2]|uniref:DNA-processing protein DprA n=1 Tax=Natrinema sp. 1APR25-10V2 TaxID=2951081 RepID=UPI002874936E|nr:DNA-processing protein DprA [Natrinema sp. 1APR25-10V2]MDS0477204.1 DNA-processing protein DprA [Natrinema sp. 1APR25-10V2]